ncbi:carboxylic ester hydrolase-like [Convolutriloba macropyga]|uniref:carboxylic ester hydrolase-like n=1 Tax=Convolutriloba macropyga TaxID=536237 RepID=UPI003F51F59E
MDSEYEVETITLDTKLGVISGEIVQVGDDCKVARFLGIPYAQQPIGDLRFEPLRPLEGKLDSEEGPFVANKRGHSAIQGADNIFATRLLMSEECIYLNIFMSLSNGVIRNPITAKSKKLPVVFHIHGGAFTKGSGSEIYYDMSKFASTHNAVGVSINYRLNYLGFISIEGEIEENLGLKDQQFALKWTHEHIGCFGGDPENVTLFGCSAGGASIHYHVLSSESSKYFKRGIASSGVLTDAWSLCSRSKQRQKVEKLLMKLRCPKNATPAEAKILLKSLTIEELYKFAPTSFSMNQLQFGPVDEYENDYLARYFISHKPLILGICAEEGNLFPDIMFPRRDTSVNTKCMGIKLKSSTGTEYTVLVQDWVQWP